MEAQNHLRDAVDRGYITERTREEHEQLAEAAIKEVTGLMEYLQSPPNPEPNLNVNTNQEARTPKNERRRAFTF